MDAEDAFQAVFLVLAVTKLLRQGRPEASVAGLAAASSLVIILLHSIVDYPLRMMSIMAVFGLVAGILAKSAVAPRTARLSTAPEADATGLLRWPRQRAALLTSAAIMPAAIFALYRSATLAGAQEAFAANDFPRAFALDEGWSDASATLASQRLKDRQFVAARALAERATAASPLDPQGPVALVMMDQAEKRGAAAGRILDILPKLGWRNPPSQYFLAFQAADRGNLAAALPHVDALLRQGLYRDQFYPFLRAATAYPDGLAALSQRLAANPKWRGDYMGNLRDLKPAEFLGHEALLTMLKHSEAPPTQAELQTYLRRIAQDGDYLSAATAFDRLFGRERDGNQIRDARFDRLAEDVSSLGPFDWQRVDAAGATLDTERDGLHVAVDGMTQGTILRQILVAPPGRYRLIWTIKPAAAPSVGWALRCVGGSYLLSASGQPQSSQPQSSGTAALRDSWVIIPDDGCSAQQLELQIDHRSNEASDLTINAVRLIRSTRPNRSGGASRAR